MSGPSTKNWKCIEDAWVEFEMRCIPPRAGADQRFAQKATFFAGAQAMLMINVKIASRDDLTEDQQAGMMHDLERELHNFGISVVAARSVMGHPR